LIAVENGGCGGVDVYTHLTNDDTTTRAYVIHNTKDLDDFEDECLSMITELRGWFADQALEQERKESE
jgi:hypothetical protein